MKFISDELWKFEVFWTVCAVSKADIVWDFNLLRASGIEFLD